MSTRVSATWPSGIGMRRPTADPSASLLTEKLTPGRLMLLAGGHCLLAEIVNLSPLLSALYAWGIAIWAVSMCATRPANIGWEALAYLMSAEILWRITRAWAAPIPVFWEFGKYASIAALLALGAKQRGDLPVAPIVYFACLLPSVPFALALPLGEARRLIAFNMAGPFALALAVSAAWRTAPADRPGLKECTAALWPIVGVAWLCARAIGSGVQFGSESNIMASAGYGPNQVSTMLGLGAFVACLVASLPGIQPASAGALIALAAWFLIQGLLTFSRGGVVAAAGALVIVALQNLRSAASGKSRGLAWGVLVAAGAIAAVWGANTITGGLLADRYGELETTGRAEIARRDIEVAKANPFFGVGPGMTSQAREAAGGVRAYAHTEYTRLIAEHGIIGVCGVLVLAGWGFGALWKNRKAPEFYTASALVVWSLLTMAHSAMRLAATGVAMGLGIATLPIRTRRAAPVVVRGNRVIHPDGPGRPRPSPVLRERPTTRRAVQPVRRSFDGPGPTRPVGRHQGPPATRMRRDDAPGDQTPR